MIGYQYKIQWLFSNPKNAYSVIRSIGAKSLDIIYLRDLNNKILDSYNKFIQYPYGLADDKTIKWLQQQVKKYPYVKIELLRR